MDPDLSKLDDYLDREGVDGYLLDADSEDADQLYLSGFDAPDPFITLYDGEIRLLFERSLEYGRAVEESRAATVERMSDYDTTTLVAEHGTREARRRVLAQWFDDHDVESVAVPPRFPLETADGLREMGVDVTPQGEGVVTEIRATKTGEEVDHVRTAQEANERAMQRAEDLIVGADVDDEGRLVHDGEVLTSERVQQEIEVALLREGCALDETIVAGGAQAAEPHERGHGPLRADEAIIVDIFPRDKASGFHADMTRTFAVGDPGETIREWYDLTAEAKRAALDAVEPGVNGEAVHEAACEVYEEAGLPTIGSEASPDTGFIHSTGHGVGLAVHELPNIGPGGHDLRPGNVITIEPGLYDPEVGGVRIEDIVVVTEDGYENLTDYHQDFVVG
ncbi:M24 family metallopeptidase [Halobacteriales archaeon Cl-PHB]